MSKKKRQHKKLARLLAEQQARQDRFVVDQAAVEVKPEEGFFYAEPPDDGVYPGDDEPEALGAASAVDHLSVGRYAVAPLADFRALLVRVRDAESERDRLRAELEGLRATTRHGGAVLRYESPYSADGGPRNDLQLEYDLQALNGGWAACPAVLSNPDHLVHFAMAELGEWRALARRATEKLQLLERALGGER